MMNILKLTTFKKKIIARFKNLHGRCFSVSHNFEQIIILHINMILGIYYMFIVFILIVQLAGDKKSYHQHTWLRERLLKVVCSSILPLTEPLQGRAGSHDDVLAQSLQHLVCHGDAILDSVCVDGFQVSHGSGYVVSLTEILSGFFIPTLKS